MMPTDDKFTMRDLCDERDANLKEALLVFYRLIKEAREQRNSGQLTFHVKDGILETWQAPRTGRIPR